MSGAPGGPRSAAAPSWARGGSTAPRRESRVVLAVLALLALGLATMRLTGPALSLRLAPVLLCFASGAAAAVVARHALRLPERSARPWLALSLVAALLALGQAMATFRGAADLGTGGWEDLPQLGAAPLGVAACLLLWPPRSGRRIGTRVLLDAAIVLVALTVLAKIVLTDVLARTDGVAVGLIAVGYPAVGALMCGIGMLTVARVAHVRRRAATWLLAAIAAMTVVALAGALGRVLGNAWFDVLTQVAWMGMLAAGIRAVDADPGQPLEEDGDQAAALPLLGFVLSHCAAYGVALLLVAGMLAGRSFAVAEGVGSVGLVLLTFLRSLLWATDADGLARRLLRTEAYFRALVQSAEDVTVVLDATGTVTWVSGAVRTQLGWSERELTGRVLDELVHVEDRSELARVAARVHARMPVGEGTTCTVRLRARDGAEREVEVSGAARTGVPGTGVRNGLVLHLRDVTAHHSARRRLERMAYTDYLTGLPNRARFMEALAEAGERATAGEPFCVLLVDLDGFKAVNDIAGHDAGDQLLRDVALELRSGAREPDLVARLGGDEFAVLAPGGPAEAERLAARLVTVLRRSFRLPGAPGESREEGPLFAVSGSIGVAELLPGDDASSAVRLADLALRAAKAAGKGCVRFSADALDDAAARRARLARDLPGRARAGAAARGLPAHRQPGPAPGARAGGAGPLAPPRARPGVAGGVHPAGGGRRADRAAAALRAGDRDRAAGRSPGRRAGPQGGRERLGPPPAGRMPRARRRPRAGGLGPAARPAGHRAHRVDAARRRGPARQRPRHPARDGLHHRPGRLRARVLLAGLPGPAAGRRAEDGPGVRGRDRAGPPQRRAGRERDRARPHPRHGRRRGGHRDPWSGGGPPGDGVRFPPGLPAGPAGPRRGGGRGRRRFRHCRSRRHRPASHGGHRPRPLSGTARLTSRPARAHSVGVRRLRLLPSDGLVIA